jgi:hypothetical protein
MNKKTGLILMFVGAYVVLLGGLFWNMSTKTDVHKIYDWFWGLSAGVVIACGAALAIKKDVFAYFGFALVGIGIAYSIGVLVYGVLNENYFSVWILIGAILSLIGLVFGVIFHIKEAIRFRKYGPTLL